MGHGPIRVETPVPVITLPAVQLPLIGLLCVAMLWLWATRKLVSACVLTTILAYSAYLLAIDITDQIEPVRVFVQLMPDFVMANCVIVGTFAFCFVAGATLSGNFITTGPQTPDGGLGNIPVPLAVGVLLVALSADGWWLFAPYPQNKDMFELVPLGGAEAMANLLILIAMNRARTARRHLGLARAGFWLVVLHYVLAGDRGSILFLLVGAYGFHLASQPRTRFRDLVKTAGLAAVAVWALDRLSFLRSWGAQGPSSGGSFLAEIDLMPQSVAHMFHAIAIHTSGLRTFEGSPPEFLMTLWVQIIPSGVLKAMGYQPYNGPLMLSDFVVHGGGFFVPAELYFVGGFPVLILVSLYFGGLAGWVDRRAARREDTFVVTVALLVAASSFYTMFYGVQAVHRMLSLPVVLICARAIFRGAVRASREARAW